MEELLTRPRLGRLSLSRYVPYLNQRWNEGCTDSGRLFRELQELGYRGSDRSVRRWLEPLRSAGAPLAQIPETPTVRQVTAWLTRHPDSLIDEETPQLPSVRRFARNLRNGLPAVIQGLSTHWTEILAERASSSPGTDPARRRWKRCNRASSSGQPAGASPVRGDARVPGS